MSSFVKAVRSLRKLHAAIDGPSGSGKTFTGLRLAFALVQAKIGNRVAVIDTEHNSASLYAGECPDGTPWEFDTLNLKTFGPDKFSEAIRTAVKEGYDTILVDSLSHAWVGEGGALDIVDQKGGKFQAWKDVTPLHRQMIDTIIRCPANVIVTMRSKTEFVMEKDERTGNTTVRKVGMAPVQRDGMEYEFDLYGSIDWSHQLKITKSRCRPMQDMTAVKPGPLFWSPLFEWLQSASASATTAAEPMPDPVPEPIGPGSAEREAEFTAIIEASVSEQQLNELAPKIKTAATAKLIDEPARKRLSDKFKAKLAKIKAAPPVAASASPAIDTGSGQEHCPKCGGLECVEGCPGDASAVVTTATATAAA